MKLATSPHNTHHELPNFHSALVVIAHPDDAEGHAGGTIAQLIADGVDVHYLVLTGGGKGSHDPAIDASQMPAIRTGEQEAAGRILGVKSITFAEGFTDGELANTRQLRAVIVRHIRRLQPDLVVSWDPAFIRSARHGIINHRDHRLAGEATLDAVYPEARNLASHPELLKEGLQPHTVRNLLLMTLSDDANCIVDISGELDLKMKAMHAHTSQTAGDDVGDGGVVLRWSQDLGRMHNCEAAEAFEFIELKS